MSEGSGRERVEATLREAVAGHYRVEREVARGAMARIFLARDLRHDRAVAIKVLPPDLATPAAAERFLREIRITAVLQHPNILPLLDSGAGAGLCWYAMPHIEGVSLRGRLEAERPLPLKEALGIAIAIARALDHAHQRGIIHRDLKPENILFSGGQAVVADFGLARAVAGSLGAGITASGLPLGTPTYMSPEQAAGSETVDHRSDLYGLGCLLYEMITGRPPFIGRSVVEVLRQQVDQEAEPMSRHRPGVSERLDRMVGKLLAKDPAARYQRAADLAADLEMAAARETLDSTAERSTLAASLATTPRRVEAAPPRRWRRSGTWIALTAAVLALGGGGWWLLGRLRAAPLEGISVAVMPLVVVEGSDDSLTRAFAGGLAQDLGRELARYRGLRVASAAVIAAADSGAGLLARSVAQALGVGHVLEGTLARRGDRLHVTLQLVETPTDAALWASAWDRGLSRLGALREEIAREAGRALQGAARNR